MNTDTSLIGYMAKNFAALSTETPWNAAAGCHEPSISEKEARFALSTAEVTKWDIANALQVVSQLLVNYPNNIGDERERLPQVGQLLRVLGGALDLANDFAECAEAQQYSHDMLSRVKLAQASQANKTLDSIEVQEQLHHVRQVKTSANEGRAAQ
ncbi:hypothetical protein [Chromobacterium vaccinii]|uniref:hypothetical protein n=1 Tax=Chromobacterium vaccinii TaxID=1108595 RepID=UPI0031E23028